MPERESSGIVLRSHEGGYRMETLLEEHMFIGGIVYDPLWLNRVVDGGRTERLPDETEGPLAGS
jgi:hypothetical protein